MGWQGYQLIIECWCLLVLTVPFVLARLYVQLWFRGRPWREVLIAVAWFSFLGYCADQSLINHWGNNNLTLNWDDKTDEELEPLAKALWVIPILYKTTLYACKAVLLLFYGDLTPRYSRKTWWAIWITWVCCIAGWAGQILASFLQCHPFTQNFAWSNWCSYNWRILLATHSWHLFTDVQVYLIPFAVLRHLRLMTWKQKRGAYFMFALGFINLGMAVILLLFRIPGLPLKYGLENDGLEVFVLPLQLNTLIIIVCLPQVRRLWLGTSAEKMRDEVNNRLEDVEVAGSLAVIPLEKEQRQASVQTV